MTLNFNTNDKIIIMTLGGYDFIAELTSTSGPHVLFPGGNQVMPGIEYWEAIQNTSCQIDQSYYIRDNGNINLYRLVGSRPANIVRR